MYKIYFDKIQIFLIEERKDCVTKNGKNALYLNENETGTFQELVDTLKKEDKINKIFISARHPQGLFRKFFRETIMVKAAGGLVTNSKGELLMIYRYGHWDLPKGKVKKKEKLPVAAVREVEEECGISGLTITKKIAPTFHVYFEKRKWFIKKTVWYAMTSTDTRPLCPQTEEHITKACWVSRNKVKTRMPKAYGNIKDVVRSAYL